MLFGHLNLLNDPSAADTCAANLAEEQRAALAAAEAEIAAAQTGAIGVAGAEVAAAMEAGTGSSAHDGESHVAKRARQGGGGPACGAIIERGLRQLRAGLSTLREAVAVQAAGGASVGEALQQELQGHMHQVNALMQELG